MDFSKIKVLVIGGCGGIGTNICDTLIKHGVKSLGVIDILEENEAHDHFKGFLDKNLKEIKFNYMKCQVFEEDSLRKAFIEIGFEDLDILINAFGIQDERNYKKMIDVNITGVISSTLIGIEMMRKNKQSGIIINIGSVVSYRKMFKSPVYVATKHAVLGFTTSLANQEFYDKTGISFITICPGATKTSMSVPLEILIQNAQFPEFSQAIINERCNFSSQSVEVVGKCVIEAILDNSNGSVWECENEIIRKI